MIHSFKVKNFYSINKEIKVSFVGKGNAISSPELYLDAPFNNKVNKVAFFGGPNGAGKSNLLRTLAFVKYLVVSSERKPGEQLTFIPFMKANAGGVSQIEVSFSTDANSIYLYKIKFNAKQIMSEELSLTSTVLVRTSEKKIYSRNWDNDKERYDVQISKKAPALKDVKNIAEILSTDDNLRKTIISLYADIDSSNGYIRNVRNYWSNAGTNLAYSGSMESENSASTLSALALTNIEATRQTASSELAREILNKIDIAFKGIAKIPVKNVAGDQSREIPGIAHHFKDHDIVLPTFFESTGTNRIIYLVDIIARALSTENGTVVILDDADASIHPDIYSMLVDYFMSPDKNQNGAQLILCSHNYTTMNQLDKQQIYLVERNDKDGSTDCWRLDEVEGVKSQENFYAKYMAGAYDAIPRGNR